MSFEAYPIRSLILDNSHNMPQEHPLMPRRSTLRFIRPRLLESSLDIEDNLGSASWRDVITKDEIAILNMPYLGTGSFTDQAPRADDCLRPEPSQGFKYIGIRSLRRSLYTKIGTEARKNTVILLDQAAQDDNAYIYQIRLAHSDLRFAWRSLVNGAGVKGYEPYEAPAESVVDRKFRLLYEAVSDPMRLNKHSEEVIGKIIAEGMFKFLMSDMADLRGSAETISMVAIRAEEELDAHSKDMSGETFDKVMRLLVRLDKKHRGI